METKIAQNFTLKTLFQFSLPTVAMMLMMSLYTVVDGIFVARFVGTYAMSAINIIMPAISVIIGIGVLFASGGSAIVARKQGQGLHDKANGLFTSIVMTCVMLGIVMLAIGLPLTASISQMLGATEVLLPYANEYAFFIYLFIPMALLKTQMDYFLITAGKPGLAFTSSIVGGVTNMVLDYVFIVSLGMGIKGAAIATGIGEVLSCCIGLFYFLRGKGALRFTKPLFHLKSLVECCTNGSSELVTSLSTGITTLLFNMAMLQSIGEDGVAAITIAYYSLFLLLPVFLGMSMGVAPMISYNYGRGDREQLRKIIRTCCIAICVLSVAVFIALELVSPTLVGIFTNGNTAVEEIAVNGMKIFSFTLLFLGINTFISSLFTALSNGKISALLSFAKNLAFVVLGIFLLPNLFGINGIWLTIPFAEVLGIGLSVTMLLVYRKKYGYGKRKAQPAE